MIYIAYSIGLLALSTAIRAIVKGISTSLRNYRRVVKSSIPITKTINSGLAKVVFTEVFRPSTLVLLIVEVLVIL